MYHTNLIYVFVCFCYSLARDLKSPVVTIPDQGTIAGVEVSKLRVRKIIAFYGIPYANPPVGDHRFAPPVTDPLPQVANNSGYLPGCLQSERDYKDAEKPFLQLISDMKFGNLSEDCLYLNVFVPSGARPQSEFATIIWFHPGSFVTGTPAIWNPHTLVYRHRIIVVTVAYRLSVLGFFTTMDSEAPGNYALLDQQAAMHWVKKNIKLFGGNPDNICLMGYEAGATSIGLHMINSGSRNLFNKAIVMSGDFSSPSVYKSPQDYKREIEPLIPKHCEKTPTSKLIECMRHIDDPTWLIDQASQIDWRPMIVPATGNYSFLQDLPINYFERGEFNQIPFLTGYTDMEQVLEIGELTNITDFSSNKLKELLSKLVYDDIVQEFNDTEELSCIYEQVNQATMFFYNPARPIKNVEQFRKVVADFITEKKVAAPTYLQASYLNKLNSTYVYEFHMKLSTKLARAQLPDWVTVPHLFDLIYIWGVPYWENTGDWDIRDKKFSDTVMSLWTSFAKSSDPREFNIYPINWEPFSEDNPGIMVIDETFNMNNSNSLNYKAFEFWNRYYPKVKNDAVKYCELAGSASTWSKNWLSILPLLLLVCVI